MAIQELDIKIRHRSGRSNANADALSRAPLCSKEDSSMGETEGVIANLGATEDDLPTLQQQDPELAVILDYLENGLLPNDETLARRVALTASQYTVEDQISLQGGN